MVNNINVKAFITKSPYLITFFILLIVKPFFYGLLIPKKEISLGNVTVIESKKNTNNYIYGRLLYQNPYKYNEEFVVAIQDNLVKINDYVINEKGLLGIISKKYQNMAIVKMLTSKDLLLQVQISNCYGLLKDSHITNVDAHCNINVGDVVYTSNLYHVKEIIGIGTISKIIRDKNNIANSFEISLFNNEIIPEEILVIGQK